MLSLGAGVDGLLRHPRLPDVPIVRFVDDELSQCMADYVVAQVAMHQRLFTQYKADQKARRWVQHYPGAGDDDHGRHHGARRHRAARRSRSCRPLG